MALDQITEAVLETARAEADLIVKSARKNAGERLAAARRAAEQDAERHYNSLVRGLQEDLARRMIQMQGAAGKELLERKNTLLQKIFSQARDRILSMPAAEYGAVMRKLLEKTASDCGGNLRVHPGDRALFEELLAGFNSGRVEALHVGIMDEQPLPERGGFIFVSDLFQVDQTLGVLLANIEYALAPVISAELFSG
jgi:vacuolar-type H+-ATPase subunit E/Vma4